MEVDQGWRLEVRAQKVERERAKYEGGPAGYWLAGWVRECSAPGQSPKSDGNIAGVRAGKMDVWTR